MKSKTGSEKWLKIRLRMMGQWRLSVPATRFLGSVAGFICGERQFAATLSPLRGSLEASPYHPRWTQYDEGGIDSAPP
jgi:hypothetical protein